MLHDSALYRLSEFVGIEPFYWDIYGGYHETTDDTRVAILSAMGYAAESEHDAEQTLKELHDTAWKRVMPPASVVRSETGNDGQQHLSVAVTLPMAARDHVLHWNLELENGGGLNGEISAANLEIRSQRFLDDVEHFQAAFDLPADIAPGYHHLSLSIGPSRAQTKLIVAPAQAYLPQHQCEQALRIAGVACQVYALRHERDWGVGDFTALKKLCDTTAQSGGDVVGLSPLHALFTTTPSRVSPYAPSSRLFTNMVLMDIEQVIGFATCKEVQTYLAKPETAQTLKAAREHKSVDYAKVTHIKRDALEILFSTFQRNHPPSSNTPERKSFDQFVQDGGDELLGFVAFEALQDHFPGVAVSQWPPEFCVIDSPASQAFIDNNSARLDFYRFVQWQSDQQLENVAQACRSGGMTIGLYRDLAVGAVSDGADTWFSPDSYVNGVRIGAPPDAFSATGQDWGIPPLHPVHLQDTGYTPFINMLRANMRHAGAIRIDHAMWLQHVYWIPPERDGRDGTYVRYPMDDLFKILALESHRNACVVVGEDLGTVPDGFRERMEHENILSYRLLMFERYPDGLFKRPDTYPPLALATPASHDLPPIAGFWQDHDIETSKSLGFIANEDEAKERRAARQRDREMLIAAMIDQGLVEADFPTSPKLSETDLQRLVDAVHGFLAKSPSMLCMVNLEDVLLMRDQINVPGTIDEHPNWRHRVPITVEALHNDRKLARCFDRINAHR